jgi:tungstate transport system ATP-binding protein
MIHIENLIVEKNGQRIAQCKSLDIQGGDHVGLIGSNGSGKSTLLKVLAGLERDWQGRVEIECPVRQRVYVHQHPFFFRGTVLDNVLYGLRARRIPSAEASCRALEWLKKFAVDGLADKDPQKLSGGEKRRVALARGFVLNPELILLDEPIAELDNEGVDLVSKVLKEFNEGTVVFVSPRKIPAGFVRQSIKLESLR